MAWEIHFSHHKHGTKPGAVKKASKAKPSLLHLVEEDVNTKGAPGILLMDFIEHGQRLDPGNPLCTGPGARPPGVQ